MDDLMLILVYVMYMYCDCMHALLPLYAIIITYLSE